MGNQKHHYTSIGLDFTIALSLKMHEMWHGAKYGIPPKTHILKKDDAKECSNYHTTVLISHASKIMPKILQARLQEYMNWELPDVEAGFRKGRGTRDQIANICWIMEKTREFQKNIYFCFIDYAKLKDACSLEEKLW